MAVTLQVGGSAPVPCLFPTTQVLWSDQTPFSGYVLAVLSNPTDNTTPWAEMDLGNINNLRLPQFQLIPIVAGLYNQSCGLYKNSDLLPPGSQYQLYYYDAGMRQIAGPSVAFSVTASPISNLPAVTLTVPAAAGAFPAPDTPPAPFD